MASIITGAAGGPLPAQVVNCPSGNCTWTEPISTLGICGSCHESIELLIRNCSSSDTDTYTENPREVTTTYCDYSFPSGPAVGVWTYPNCHTDSSNELINCYTSWTLWNSSQEDFPLWKQIHEEQDQNGPAVLAKFNALQLDPPGNDSGILTAPDPRGFSCELHFCEKIVSSLKVVNGAGPVSETSEEVLYWLPSNDSILDSSAFPMATKSVMTNTAIEGPQNYSVSYLDLSNLQGYLAMIFAVSYADTLLNTYSMTANNLSFELPTAPHFVPGLSFGLPLGAHLGRLFANSQDVNQTLSKLTTSMTEAIRTGSNATAVYGQVLVSKTYIHVRWAWLSLPLATMLLTCGLLLIVAIQCRNKDIPIWKDDPLPLLLHRLDGLDYSMLTDNKRSGPSDLENLVRAVHIKMSSDKSFMFERTHSVPIKG